MMICTADFQELFPETFAPGRRDDAHIARWEDDGGATPPAPAPHDDHVGRPAPAAYGFADPARVGLAMAALPMMSAGTMLSAFGFQGARD
ncbi:hypothetical protein D6850_07755 [Roseovarius spongiae]|uniref:Uncharacterized protein n=1 Tax=Roseovarius spongiae TaxID=2320272 RepID=A0A3A8B9A7_9RHOB|nr:hypothetical protein [Roseovarius spongiae]RKF14765.1 hypothetical protein D6850_07755 [Roseovarius spongiae]